MPKEQRTWEGKEMLVQPPRTSGLPPAVIDDEVRTLYFPRESIYSVRELPEDYDMNNVRLVLCNSRLDLVVDGAPNSSIDDYLED